MYPITTFFLAQAAYLDAPTTPRLLASSQAFDILADSVPMHKQRQVARLLWAVEHPDLPLPEVTL